MNAAVCLVLLQNLTATNKVNGETDEQTGSCYRRRKCLCDSLHSHGYFRQNGVLGSSTGYRYYSHSMAISSLHRQATDPNTDQHANVNKYANLYTDANEHAHQHTDTYSHAFTDADANDYADGGSHSS